jgi:hypothetical protein
LQKFLQWLWDAFTQAVCHCERSEAIAPERRGSTGAIASLAMTGMDSLLKA